MTSIARTLLAASIAVVFVAGCSNEVQDEPSAECAAPCVTPPAPTCDDTVAVTYEATGTCVLGECRYSTRREDCENGGGVCVDGVCESGPPVELCAAVVCDAPPESACDAAVAVTYDATGTCEVVDGEPQCRYDERRDDCGDSGEICAAGECMVNSLCADVRCDDPPADGCDGTIAEQWSAEGVCDAGTCSYRPERVDCADTGQLCVDGACVAEDLCAGVVCTEPPEDSCDGETLVRWRSNGECAGGVCDYVFDRIDCTVRDEICEAARCAEPGPCDRVICDRPPAPSCRGDIALGYDEPGICEDGICSYPPIETRCSDTAEVCIDGECFEPDACTGIVCRTPPPAECRDEVAIGFPTEGTCSEGTCTYEPVETDCAAGGDRCVDGECEPLDLCAGVSCTSPPPAECDASTSIVSSLPGACEDGECSYFVVEEDCTAIGGSCVDGFCETPDRCAEVSCDVSPPGRCEGTVLVEYFGRGLCDPDTGECDFSTVEDRIDCADAGLICIAVSCQGPGAAFGPDELLVTEFMADPAEGSSHQWVEVRDLAGGGELGGLVIENAGGTLSFEVPLGTSIPDGGVVVFGSTADAADGDVDVVWGGAEVLAFDSTSDAVVLRGVDEIDRVAYDATWPCSTDVACMLGAENLFGDNSDRAAWCAAVDEAGGGWFGTPGAANPACVAVLAPGDVVINELMIDGTSRPGGREQWIELLNTTDEPVDLSGLRLETEETEVLVPWGSVVGAGDFFFATYDDLAGGGAGDLWFFDELIFAVDGDTLTLRLADTVVDTVDFSAGSPPWPYAAGVSMQRRAPTADASTPAAWCAAVTSYSSAGVTNQGTPAATNACD